MLKEMFSAILLDLERGVSESRISLKFHNTMAQMVTQMCELISQETGIAKVALSGGYSKIACC